MRKFNVTGLCVQNEDYMVDISGKIEQIKKLVDGRCYFTINRARQYGKTTTLACLEKTLKNDYLVVSISFEGIGDESFESADIFCRTFLELICGALEFTDASAEYKESWIDNKVASFIGLSRHITKMCKDRKVVLMIDEIDKTSNNRVFLHFLGMLRNKFLARKNKKDYTFHSVILAGVYDIKNIKLKMMDEGIYKPAPEENKLFNSPWNIAVDFEVDMSFSPAEIATMLSDYEAGHNTGMDITAIACEIYNYTSGYPFLVSRICKHIDEKLGGNWSLYGIQEAVKIILDEKNMLFDDLFKNMENNRDLYDFIYSILINGEIKDFVIHDPLIELGVMYGFFKRSGDRLNISCVIFERVMANYLISKESRLNPEKQITGVMQNDVAKGGKFDMELCFRKFIAHYNEMFSDDIKDLKFLEKHGRMLFLSYLKPLINGHGFYHIESETRNRRRMDIVVDFGREQFILELKIWKGESLHQEAYEQLAGYMESKNASVGYLLTFDFRKEVKQPRAEWVDFDGKRIFDAVV